MGLSDLRCHRGLPHLLPAQAPADLADLPAASAPLGTAALGPDAFAVTLLERDPGAVPAAEHLAACRRMGRDRLADRLEADADHL